MVPHFSKLPIPRPPPPISTPFSVTCTCPVSIKSPPQRYLRGFTALYRHWNYFLPKLSVATDGNGGHEWVANYLEFKTYACKKITPKIILFPNENCLINLSTEAFCVRVNTLHRIGLKKQCPRDIDPLIPFKTNSPCLSLPVAWQHIQLSVPKSI